MQQRRKIPLEGRGLFRGTREGRLRGFGHQFMGKAVPAPGWGASGAGGHLLGCLAWTFSLTFLRKAHPLIGLISGCWARPISIHHGWPPGSPLFDLADRMTLCATRASWKSFSVRWLFWMFKSSGPLFQCAGLIIRIALSLCSREMVVHLFAGSVTATQKAVYRRCWPFWALFMENNFIIQPSAASGADPHFQQWAVSISSWISKVRERDKQKTWCKRAEH